MDGRGGGGGGGDLAALQLRGARAGLLQLRELLREPCPRRRQARVHRGLPPPQLRPRRPSPTPTRPRPHLLTVAAVAASAPRRGRALLDPSGDRHGGRRLYGLGDAKDAAGLRGGAGELLLPMQPLRPLHPLPILREGCFCKLREIHIICACCTCSN